MNIERTNIEGYEDPTAYAALQSIEREEGAWRPRPRKLVFICSPLAGDIPRNMENARRYSLYAIERGVVPVAPHLLYTQFLDDENPAHRAIGISCGLTILRRCREIWVFGGHASEGMRKEIAFARKHLIELRFFDERCEEVDPFA